MKEQNEKEKNLPEVKKPMHPAAIGASLFLDVNRFEFAQRVATMLSKSTMVPDHFKGNVGNCMIALNLAERFMADPFMVMQTIYVVHGKPGLEGKLVISLLNQCGKFSPLQYKFTRDNDGKATACTAYATHLETKEKLEQTVTWSMVHAEGWDAKKGSKWLTMPELMFQYRSATFFARVYCPEVILGMQTTDEIFDFTNMTNQGGTYKVNGADTSDLSEKIKEAKKTNGAEPTKNVDEEPTEPEETETVEENKEEPDLQKMEKEEPDGMDTESIVKHFEGNAVDEKAAKEELLEFDWDNWRNTWINLRTPGYSSQVHKNRSKWDAAPAKMQAEGEAKWNEMYRGVPWPVKNKPVENEEEKVQMINAISEFFEPEDVTKALHEYDQETLTSCDMEMLRNIHKYLRENAGGEDLA